MATETVPVGEPSAIEAASMALLDALRIIDAMSAVVSKLQEEVQALPGHANGLTISLDLLLEQLHAIVGPAQEAAFQAIDSHAEDAHV